MEETVVLDAKVQELKRHSLRKFREVMRDLVEIRHMTGVVELVSLGSLLSEYNSEHVLDSKKDSRIGKALEHGVSVRHKLIEDEGGSLSAEEAAAALGMSKVAVLKRYRNGKLLAWQAERQNAIRFPAWQFRDGKVLDNLEEAIEKLNQTSRLDDFGRMLFFLSNSSFLGGKRPLDCLRNGDVQKVMLLAANYGG